MTKEKHTLVFLDSHREGDREESSDAKRVLHVDGWERVAGSAGGWNGGQRRESRPATIYIYIYISRRKEGMKE